MSVVAMPSTCATLELALFQLQLSALMEQIQKMNRAKVGRQKVCHIICKIEGHMGNDCPSPRFKVASCDS